MVTNAPGVSEFQAGGGVPVEVRGLSKIFRTSTGTVEALKGIDLSVKPGEFVSIVGASGCGKSTLLRALAGLEAPTTGDMMIGGQSPAQRSKRHELGMAFQDAALLPWRTIAANIAFALEIAGRPRNDALVSSLIDLVGLTGFEKARPSQLSGGMRQRAAIARALALEPPLLLLDEPFGALDELTRQRLNEELQRIWMRATITTIMVTHSVSEAVFLSDRIVVMSPRPGRIIDVVDVTFPRERDFDVTATAEFAALSAAVSRALRADQP